jgi:hypothetical protein
MIEKFKNLSFPVKFGLAFLVPPLALVACAYYSQPVRGTIGYEHGQGGFLPFFFIFAAELPLSLILSWWLSSQGVDESWTWKLFYPGKYILLSLIPTLFLWFVVGYLVGRFCARLSIKTQKSCLFLLVAVPIAGAVLLIVRLLLGEWANAMSFGFYP